MIQTERTGQETWAGPHLNAPFLPWGEIMRASFLAVATAAVVVLVSALAESRTRPALHPDTLARYEAITSYCGKIDSASASQFAAKLDGLTQGWSADEIAAKRASGGYRDAMAQADDTLSRASHTTAVNGCTEFLAEK
jgi:hypothetical protein